MSKKFELAGDIAGALAVGERSMNQAALDLLAVGTAVFTARNSGHFHPLEAQREVAGLVQLSNDLLLLARADEDRLHQVRPAEVRADESTGSNSG